MKIGAEILAGLFVVASYGQTPSLFSDFRARSVGDAVTVLIVEYSSASSEAKTSTQKDNDHGLTAFGGSAGNAYSPMYGIRGNVKNSFDGSASVSREGRLTAKISATISQIKPNGDLLITGSRTVEVNGEKEITTITGTVRPSDISLDNTVYSYQLADAQIAYQGKGVVNNGQKPGFIAKLMNFIF